jgi:hypothetical protein
MPNTVSRCISRPQESASLGLCLRSHGLMSHVKQLFGPARLLTSLKAQPPSIY